MVVSVTERVVREPSSSKEVLSILTYLSNITSVKAMSIMRNMELGTTPILMRCYPEYARLTPGLCMQPGNSKNRYRAPVG